MWASAPGTRPRRWPGGRRLWRVVVAVVGTIALVLPAGEALAASVPLDVAAPTTVSLVDRIELSWSAPDDGGSPLLSYRVYAQWGTDPVPVLLATVAADQTSYAVPADQGSRSTLRLFSVHAVNAVGEGSGTPVTARLGLVDYPFLRARVDGTSDLAIGQALGDIRQPGPFPRAATLDPAGDHVGLAMTRDAGWLAFGVRASAGSDLDLYSIRTDGSGSRTMLAGEPGVDESHPTWAPDGSAVIYARGSGAGTALWRVGVSGGAPAGPPAAVPGGAGLRDPDWAPTGDFLVAHPASGTGALVRLDPVGGARVEVPGTAGAVAAAVSPRADAVAFLTVVSDPITGLQGCTHLVPLGRVAPVVDLDCFPVPSVPDPAVIWDPQGEYLYFVLHTSARTWLVTYNGRTGERLGGSSLPAPPGVPLSFTRRAFAHNPGPGVLFSPAFTSQHVKIAFVPPIQPDGSRFPTTCSLDGGAAQACTSPFTAWVSPGSHTVTVTSTLTPSAVTWTARPETRSTDRTGDGRPDVLAKDKAGTIWVYPAGGTAFGSRVKFQTYGPSVTLLSGFTFDYTDAVADLLIRDAGGILSSVEFAADQPQANLATGWLSMTATLASGDLDASGTQDLLARDTAGKLWFYEGTIIPGGEFLIYPTRRQIGSGWQGYARLIAPGDWDGDHWADLMAVDSAGALWLYRGNGTGTFLARQKIGSGWHGFTAVIAPGDFDGDGHPDLMARDSAGGLWLYTGNGTGGFLTKRQIGSGWAGFTQITA